VTAGASSVSCVTAGCDDSIGVRAVTCGIGVSTVTCAAGVKTVTGGTSVGSVTGGVTDAVAGAGGAGSSAGTGMTIGASLFDVGGVGTGGRATAAMTSSTRSSFTATTSTGTNGGTRSSVVTFNCCSFVFLVVVLLSTGAALFAPNSLFIHGAAGRSASSPLGGAAPMLWKSDIRPKTTRRSSR
jgi:hypothetical protein